MRPMHQARTGRAHRAGLVPAADTPAGWQRAMNPIRASALDHPFPKCSPKIQGLPASVFQRESEGGYPERCLFTNLLIIRYTDGFLGTGGEARGRSVRGPEVFNRGLMNWSKESVAPLTERPSRATLGREWGERLSLLTCILLLTVPV
jgi:hypothetical protein